MKTITTILFLIISTSFFSQQIDENIIGITGLRKFKNDSCNCKTKIKKSYDYRFFGLKKTTKITIKTFDNQLLKNNNGNEINYDSSNNYIRSLVNSSTLDIGLDTIIKVFFNFYNPQGKKGGQINYNAEFHFKNGLLIRKDRDYLNDEYISHLFYSYDSNTNNIKVFNQDRYDNKKHLVKEFLYDTNGNNTHHIEYDNYEKKNDTTFLIKYYYNEQNQLIKEVLFYYGFLKETVTYEYNEKGLISKEIYFSDKYRWDSSWEILYNEKNQEIESYELNRREKRKRLVEKYEYEY